MTDLDEQAVAELLPFMTEEEQAQLDILLNTPEKWGPQIGPQEAAFTSKADIIGLGGAAGGGKSDLLLGMTLKHRRSVIFRREYAQLEGLLDRSREMFRHLGRFRASPHPRWVTTYENILRVVEFGGIQHTKDLNNWQGRPHDFIGFDEATHFLRAEFEFLMTWLRTTVFGLQCQVVATFNPPDTAEGRWVIEYWAPWLDRNHPNPAKPGELRWFVRGEQNEDVEVPDGKPVRIGARMVKPKSRTFIPAKVKDNLYYAGTDYEATLDALPEPLRSQMRDGDFYAGMSDHEWQVIPTAWVEAAQDRWRKLTADPAFSPGPLDAIGFDVARGGEDESVASPKRGRFFGRQLVKPGRATPDGPAAVRMMLEALGDEKAPVKTDVIGVGSSPVDIGKMHEIEIIPLNGSNRTAAKDKSGRLRFSNKRAEWHWKLREALDPAISEDEALAIPPDPRIKADLTAPRWSMASNGIKIEEKKEIKERIKRSPDRGESLMYAHAESGNRSAFAVPIITATPRYGTGT